MELRGGAKREKRAQASDEPSENEAKRHTKIEKHLFDREARATPLSPTFLFDVLSIRFFSDAHGCLLISRRGRERVFLSFARLFFFSPPPRNCHAFFPRRLFLPSLFPLSLPPSLSAPPKSGCPSTVEGVGLLIRRAKAHAGSNPAPLKPTTKRGKRGGRREGKTRGRKREAVEKERGREHSSREFLFFVFFYSKPCVSAFCASPSPPSLGQWRHHTRNFLSPCARR